MPATKMSTISATFSARRAVFAGADPTDPTTPAFGDLHTGNTFLGSLDGGRTARLFDPQDQFRALIDTSLIFKPSICGKQDLTFALNVDYGKDGGARWYGAAFYTKWQFSKKWYLGIRAESYDDVDGVRTGIKQKMTEGTITLDWALTDAAAHSLRKCAATIPISASSATGF